jgi:arabinofuranosyltransferase
VLVLLGIAANHTVVTWYSSGLETALFGAAAIGWTLLATTAAAATSVRSLLGLATAAAVAGLTRPDGALLVLATLGIAALRVASGGLRAGAAGRGLVPLFAVVAHVVWRRARYGEWLPNTYYAKVTGAWPEAGLRYAACFAIEHGAWLWAPVLLGAGLVIAGRHLRRLPKALGEHAAPLAAVAVVLFQAGYYTFVVGGDHFEYRVYSHLVPLAVLATTAVAARVAAGALLPALAALGLGLAGSPSWLHLHLTRDMPEHGFRPVAPQLPEVVRPLARRFDAWQAWLRLHMVCLRCNHHARFLARNEQQWPVRGPVHNTGDAFPVISAGAVGIPGWVLPDVAIVDLHGLNDWVVARNPVTGFGTPPTRETLLPLVAAADADRDGWLQPGELRQALQRLTPQSPDPDAYDYLGAVLFAIYARERADAMSFAEAAGIGESLAGARSMAHEKAPPAGYVDGLRPNVAIEGRVAIARPRDVPLTAEAIRAFEAEWRAKVLRGELGRPR